MKVFRAALAVGLLAAAPASTAPGDAASSMTIRLVSTPGAVEEFEDRPPYGVNSKGDYFRQTSILRNAVPQFGRTKGARVGTDDFTLKFLSRTKRVLTGTTRLPGGTLRIKEFGRIGVSTPRDPVVAGLGSSRARVERWKLERFHLRGASTGH